MTDTTQLTERQAMAAYRAVTKVLDERLGYEGQLLAGTKDATPTRQGINDPQWNVWPVLCEDFEQQGNWAIVWEGGDFEWAYRETVYKAAESVAGVFAEPWFSFALGLYRKE